MLNADNIALYYDLPEARAARFDLCDNHLWVTFAAHCRCTVKTPVTRYGVVGTDYGVLRNALGDYKLWKSASSAYRAAKAYRDN